LSRAVLPCGDRPVLRVFYVVAIGAGSDAFAATCHSLDPRHGGTCLGILRTGGDLRLRLERARIESRPSAAGGASRRVTARITAPVSPGPCPPRLPAARVALIPVRPALRNAMTGLTAPFHPPPPSSKVAVSSHCAAGSPATVRLNERRTALSSGPPRWCARHRGLLVGTASGDANYGLGGDGWLCARQLRMAVVWRVCARPA